MPRAKGVAGAGSVRSVRLPSNLDRWFEERLMLRPERSSSELLVELLHGGLRLRDGYMSLHRHSLERLIREGNGPAILTYLQALDETFGYYYVEHLRSWLIADGLTLPKP